MKKTVNRFLSTFLVMCMLVLTVPVGAFAEPAADGPVVWESSRISELTTEEMGEGVIYVGTSGGRAEEKGQYVLTLYRDGYSDGEATVPGLTQLMRMPSETYSAAMDCDSASIAPLVAE